MSVKIILGIDPGLNNTGWGVVKAEGSSLSYIAGGTIKTTTKQTTTERLKTIHDGFTDLIEKYQPTTAAIEEVFVNENARTSLKLGQARGVAILAAGIAGLECAEYTPTAIKKAIVGTGRADKTQIGYMINMLLPGAKPKTEDAADALAVAICHAHTSQNQF